MHSNPGSNRVEGCSICTLAASGKAIWSDAHWMVTPMGDAVGCFLVLSRRHVEGVWNLTESEAAGYGVLLRRLGGEIAKQCDPARLYVVTIGEGFPHFHSAVMPRAQDAPVDERILAVVTAHAERRTDAGRAGTVAAAIGKALG